MLKRIFLTALLSLWKKLTFMNSTVLYFYAMEQHHVKGMTTAESVLEFLFIEGE